MTFLYNYARSESVMAITPVAIQLGFLLTKKCLTKIVYKTPDQILFGIFVLIEIV